MASDPEFLRFVCEQLRGAGDVTSRRMFGEAAVYLDEKVVALVCDNQLFIKPTDPGRAKIGKPILSPPFAGAANWFLMADLDDPEFLAEVIRTTADALPVPKRKTKTQSKTTPKSKQKANAKIKVKPKQKTPLRRKR